MTRGSGLHPEDGARIGSVTSTETECEPFVPAAGAVWQGSRRWLHLDDHVLLTTCIQVVYDHV
ncbi:hypothetical protein BCY76_009030 [Nesterenkonia sp. PF2B19]|nr:hypothetical protein BCY76_009030 [Nesterenkonia sp. PF2B19]